MWFSIAIVSITANVFLLYYIRWLLKSVAEMSKDVESLQFLIQDFTSHVKTIYELEMFYGDDTLKGLFDHARQLTDQLENIDLILNDKEEGEPVEEEKKEN